MHKLSSPSPILTNSSIGDESWYIILGGFQKYKPLTSIPGNYQLVPEHTWSNWQAIQDWSMFDCLLRRCNQNKTFFTILKPLFAAPCQAKAQEERRYPAWSLRIKNGKIDDTPWSALDWTLRVLLQKSDSCIASQFWTTGGDCRSCSSTSSTKIACTFG